MSGQGLYRRRRQKPEMILVPLIDVLVMLIFFAFVTMQFKSATTLNIRLPKISTAGKNQFTGKITISIEKDGALTFNGERVTDAELPGLLQRVHQADKNIPVLIRADEDVPLKRVTYVWDQCRKVGLLTQSLQSR